MWVVGVGYKKGQKDPLGENTKSEIMDLRISGVKDVRTFQTYVIKGGVSEGDVKKTGETLFTDSVNQYFNYDRFDDGGKHIKSIVKDENAWVVEVFFRPGVMDAVGLSVEKSLDVIGVKNVESVGTGTIYVIKGDLSEEDVKTICENCLANGLVQSYRYQRV